MSDDSPQRAQHLVADSAVHYAMLLDGVVDHAVYLLHPDGRVASWNTGAQRIKGYLPEEIIGRPYAAFFTPEDAAAGEPARVLAYARQHGHFESEAWRVRRDGSRFWARVGLTAIRDPAGTLLGFAKVAQDLTARKIEEAQRAIIIESAPNGMMIVDEAGRITLANARAEEIFGYKRGTLAGLEIQALLPEAARTTMAGLGVLLGINGDAPQIREIGARRRDGSDVTVEALLRPVRTPHGSLFIASVADLTERLRLQADQDAAERQERRKATETRARLEQLAANLAQARDQAEQANAAKSRFLAGITHELRTPLNGILGYAQLLASEGGLNPQQWSRVEAMLGAGQHLLDMINSVLDLSQIESDQLVLQPRDIDLPALARTCLDVVRPGAEGKGLTLAMVNFFETPPRLFADATRLRQVLVNLLGNAVKFTPSGSVALRLLPSADGPGARLEVADTGPGIAPAQRAKLFQEFERLEAGADGVVEGSGLGLAISIRLVQRMGGRMGYADNAGGGSVFWVELPPGEVSAEAMAGGGGAEARPCGALHVLVVDDVLMNRDVAAGFLRLAGHTVSTADSGEAAIEAAAGGQFDVILMDVRMPGMDGLEATRRIRALPAPHGEVPVVAMTAEAFADQIQKCRAAGMVGHVSKPIERDVLLEAVARAGTALVPAAPATPDFDDAMFAAVAATLSRDVLEGHLGTLLQGIESLRTMLQAADMAESTVALAEEAHRVGGSAGCFGFTRVAGAARHFQRAAEHDAAAVPQTARALTEALTAALSRLPDLLAAVPV